jgi:hypothetical protein
VVEKWDAGGRFLTYGTTMDFMGIVRTATALATLTIGILPGMSQAQQNLFNVPSADITEQGKFFFQQQFNFFTAATGSSNTTLDYGLGDQLEIGINLFNVDMQPTDGTFQNPHVLLNFQKGFALSENYKVSFGTQTGITPPLHRQTVEMPSFSYLHSALDLKHLGKYYLGSYYTNRAYAGKNEFGFMTGMEYPLFEKKLHLMGDFISGDTEISVAVLGLVVFLPREWQLSLGAQLPAPSTQNDYAMVFEITKL